MLWYHVSFNISSSVVIVRMTFTVVTHNIKINEIDNDSNTTNSTYADKYVCINKQIWIRCGCSSDIYNHEISWPCHYDVWKYMYQLMSRCIHRLNQCVNTIYVVYYMPSRSKYHRGWWCDEWQNHFYTHY